MAQWSKLVQEMPKPNTPISLRPVIAGAGLLRGRLRRRQARRRGAPLWWFDWSDRNWVPIEIKPEDEGITWCRGHRGPAVDRLAVVAGLTAPTP